MVTIAVGAVVTVESVVCFPSTCGNHQEEAAGGILWEFPRVRQFPQPFAAALFRLEF